MKVNIKKIIAGCVGGAIFIFSAYKLGVVTGFFTFVNDYRDYTMGDIKLQAKLFERIVGGICGGATTFGVLFITIKHENKKNRELWLQEIDRDKEKRILEKRPFLDIEINTVSMLRSERFDGDTDYIMVGTGTQYVYANITLKNNGYGECQKITLDGRRSSFGRLRDNQSKDVTLYFIGLDKGSVNEFVMYFGYQNVLGNDYLQEFKCCLDVQTKSLVVEKGEPLLKGEV